MNIKQAKIDDIHPYARNPRQNGPAIAKVAASLKEFGWQQPIVVDQDNIVIAGHTRLEAARTLDMQVVPITVAKDLTNAQVKAFRIADNKVSEKAEWDNDLLALEITDLADAGFENLDSLGFEVIELEDLMAEDRQTKEEKLDPINFGGATAMMRTNVPIDYWTKEGYLEGSKDILDFGCGKVKHKFDKYDPFHAPNHPNLLLEFDVVMCNYVMNVQPADHLVIQLCALISHLVRKDGVALIAIRNDVKKTEQTTRGWQVSKTQEEWHELLSTIFLVEDAQASKFHGFVCQTI